MNIDCFMGNLGVKIMSDETKYKKEIKAWKETCELVSDKKIMSEIKKSLDQIKKGKFYKLSDL